MLLPLLLKNGISMSPYFRPSSVKILMRKKLFSCAVLPRSSRSTWRYRMIAGAPGASGSLVIFNSSGVTGGMPSAMANFEETVQAKLSTNAQKEVFRMRERGTEGVRTPSEKSRAATLAQRQYSGSSHPSRSQSAYK